MVHLDAVDEEEEEEEDFLRGVDSWWYKTLDDEGRDHGPKTAFADDEFSNVMWDRGVQMGSKAEIEESKTYYKSDGKPREDGGMRMIDHWADYVNLVANQ